MSRKLVVNVKITLIHTIHNGDRISSECADSSWILRKNVLYILGCSEVQIMSSF